MLVDPRQIRPTVISAANPVTKLFASLVITAALVITVDLVSAGVALLIELILLPATGIPLRAMARVLAPIGISAAIGGLVAMVLGVDSGAVLLGAGPFTVTEGSFRDGIALGLRVMAIALPGIALLVSTDPTDLADALGQKLRLPARFVLGALAGLRLVGVMAAQWQALTMARRARGLGDSTGVLGGTRVLAGQAFALLVLAVRRGTRLAMAMEGRGFGSPTPRTWARPSVFTRRDLVVAAGGVLLAVTLTTAAILAGTWNPIFT